MLLDQHDHTVALLVDRARQRLAVGQQVLRMSLSLSPFQLKVFALVRMVPMGYVTTYGEVAKATGRVRTRRGPVRAS